MNGKPALLSALALVIAVFGAWGHSVIFVAFAVFCWGIAATQPTHE